MRFPHGRAVSQRFLRKAGLPDYWCNGDFTSTISA